MLHVAYCVAVPTLQPLQVLALVMMGPRSYTAEDVVEIHTHGGDVCAQRVLRAVLAAGARLARPGEFTLRAFLNGRLDLSQAESVAQIISARTPAAADSAFAGLLGGLGATVARMRADCLAILAELDARYSIHVCLFGGATHFAV
jgi:tRNA modification GTPase